MYYHAIRDGWSVILYTCRGGCRTRSGFWELMELIDGGWRGGRIGNGDDVVAGKVP